jgi:hypothetical protein
MFKGDTLLLQNLLRMYNLHPQPWIQLMKLLQKQSLNVILYGVGGIGKKTTLYKCLYDLYGIPIQKKIYEKDGFAYKRDELYYEFNCEQTIYNLDDVWIRFIKDIFYTQKIWSSRKLIVCFTNFHKLHPHLQKKIMNYKNNTIQLIIHTESLHIQPILKAESYILTFREPSKEAKYIRSLDCELSKDNLSLINDTIIYFIKKKLSFKIYCQKIKTISYYLICCHISLVELMYCILKQVSLNQSMNEKINTLVREFCNIDIQKKNIHYDLISYEYVFLILYKYIHVN